MLANENMYHHIRWNGTSLLRVGKMQNVILSFIEVFSKNNHISHWLVTNETM